MSDSLALKFSFLLLLPPTIALAAMEIGLRDTEAVVRLGQDDMPVVLQGLEKQESAQWIRLNRKQPTLSQLLRGKKNPKALMQCTIFDKITDSHRLAVAKLRSTQQDAHGGSPDTPGAVDKVDALDLGDDQEVRVSRRSQRKSRVHLPLAVDIKIDLGPAQEPWAFRALTCLGKTGRKAVAIELTVNNLQRLRGLVLEELSGIELESMASPRRAPIPKPAARPPRALADGTREYWCGARQHWVVKKAIGKWRYRTLVRKPTPLQPPHATSAVLPHVASGSGSALVDNTAAGSDSALVDRADDLDLGD